MYLLKVAVLLFAVAISLLAFEFGLRLTRERMDYLAPELIQDPILGYRIEPHTGGHDRWGFRNLAVPERSDVVAIGDSNTWGVAARWDVTWPSWYARKSGKGVYNLGVSGYGPAEYLHLMETKALALEPGLILVGFYYGNDFSDTYRSVLLQENWSDWRTESMRGLARSENSTYSMPGAPFINDEGAKANPVKQVRNWLRRHSMLFRIIEEGPIGTRVNAWGDQQQAFGGSACDFSLEVPFSTVVQIEENLRGLDLTRPAIEEGLELSLLFLKHLALLAQEHGAELVVVLIPTKVSVLMDRSNATPPGCEKLLEQALFNEEQVDERVRAFLSKEGIPFVETRNEMRKSAQEKSIYLRSADSHPNGAGYEVIADQVVAFTGPAAD
ncbi:MAG: hypothetical protein VX252_06855 [Myxococcota bacterium]|nr:hypothetical protein [Myxococcota bacterium]